MRKLLAAILFPVFFLGCRENVTGFWNNHQIDYSNIQSAQDTFVEFAQIAVNSPVDEALESIDVLFDRLKEDPVAYYLYSDWMDGAFYSLLSPCRSAALFSKAVERIVKDGVLAPSDCDPFIQKREWIQFNQAGHNATVPGVSSFGERTLVLVLDQSCPSCREALSVLASYDAARKIAICCSYGPAPEASGWEIISPDDAQAVFDPHMTPVFFVVSPDGTVERGYTIAL